MKKARMNISHSRFILLKLKIFGEIVTTNEILWTKVEMTKLKFSFWKQVLVELLIVQESVKMT